MTIAIVYERFWKFFNSKIKFEISSTCSKLEKFPDSDKKIVKLKAKEARKMNKNPWTINEQRWEMKENQGRSKSD